MPAKPVFMMSRKGANPVPVKYDRLIYTRGTGAHIFALHRDAQRDWIVSDPVSGYAVLRIRSTYKGLPVASRSLNLSEARQCALADLDDLVDRIGIDKFESVLDAAHARATGEPVAA
jgi:hypothetical protein